MLNELEQKLQEEKHKNYFDNLSCLIETFSSDVERFLETAATVALSIPILLLQEAFDGGHDPNVLKNFRNALANIDARLIFTKNQVASLEKPVLQYIDFIHISIVTNMEKICNICPIYFEFHYYPFKRECRIPFFSVFAL